MLSETVERERRIQAKASIFDRVPRRLSGPRQTPGFHDRSGRPVLTKSVLAHFQPVLPLAAIRSLMAARPWMAAALSLLVVLSAAPTQAKSVALLVGVSDYDETIGLADLRGPVNDVLLMRDALESKGISDIRLLADGIEGADRPTKAAIMAALGQLAEEAKAGDFFIIHMSGHGTRQPDNNGDEGDGYDEVFLPADVTRAEPGTLEIPNGIVDEEIGDAVRSIRARGADVWFIMDACHSGTGLRAGALNTADRFVDPARLGLPDVTTNAVENRDDAIVVDRDDKSEVPGRLIAFYSAQSDELAREVDFGAAGSGAANGSDNTWFGLFTAKLANRIQTAGAITYRQLFQNVMADMNSTSVPGAARLQTPFWEGTLIDAAVLGGSATVGVRQYSIRDDLLSAGLVHGLTEGTVVELVEDSAAGPGDVIGFAQIEEVTPLSSFVRPIDDDCVPDATILCETSGRLPPNARFARIAVVPVETKIILSPIFDRDGPADGATPRRLGEDHPLAVELNAAISSVNAAGSMRFDVHPDSYDIEISLVNGALWFGRNTLLDGEPLGLSWTPDTAQTMSLNAVLSRIAYAERFAATFTSIADSGSLLNMSPVRVAATLRSSDPGQLEKPGKTVDPFRECGRIIRRNAFAPEGTLPPSAEVKQCDIVSIAARGEVGGARDVNRIHIDSNFCVHAQYARVEDNRIDVAIGSDMTLCSDCPDGYSAGDERVFVVVSEFRENTDQLNLEGVVENCTAEEATRSAGARSLNDLLSSVRKPAGTRGAMGGFATEKVWVEKLNWRVLPRRVALQGVGENP